MCSRQFAPSMEDKLMSNSHQIKPVTLRPKTQAFWQNSNILKHCNYNYSNLPINKNAVNGFFFFKENKLKAILTWQILRHIQDVVWMGLMTVLDSWFHAVVSGFIVLDSIFLQLGFSIPDSNRGKPDSRGIQRWNKNPGFWIPLTYFTRILESRLPYMGQYMQSRGDPKLNSKKR